MPRADPTHHPRILDTRGFSLSSTGSLNTLVASVSYHALTAWLFVRNDIFNLPTVGVFFGVLNGLIAHKAYGGPDFSMFQVLLAVPSMILWTWSHLLIFNLHNQLGGLTEDAINKPWRPIPQGRISERQTRILLCLLYPLTVLLAAKIGGLNVSLLELGACLWYNHFEGGSDPFLKNLLNGIGISCFLAGPLEVVLQRSIATDYQLATWMLIIGCAIVTTVHVQDFRDVAGDKASGRQTIPIVIGDWNARLVASGGLFLFTLLSYWFWSAGWKESGAAWLGAAMLTKTLLLNRDQEANDFAWKTLWFLWLLGLFLIPFFKHLIGH
ncbi:UbiA prenyltransferase family-domain-containing protein [Truncatella angustata]|uniref:UbiA prenyltransferase family-domain-containing protein n=1 Tax=Truncatella angustata TaxID=152316 RepID=A0A9P8UM76_9PEZI|nr:UbiA prenyltransferase family-domain-containing protein [Truncatella angustata]KAH6654822.1 UbiA prenyltransferase family-domain-containing protein [Truncatella angustata]